tara:strand:- start:145 stop:2037 length:1893 start_codon:yes stop_codon:yes gene_type:complete
MSTGKIDVQTENIFPIIKKFLYSDHEIFLRELVSNAVDASSKLKALAKMGEFNGELGQLRVEVKLDPEAKTLTISDNGVGMSEEEVGKYLNQVAFSGAEEFLQKYEGKAEDSGIIGHFGLGFYSAFMVSERVEVVTKSFTGAPAVKWECDGSPEYTITEAERAERGTDIILHIDSESKEFLEEDRIAGILDKYCKFLPVEIKFGTKTINVDDPSGEKDENDQVKQIEEQVDNIVNNPSPAWNKMPADLSDEDYKKFYRELYPSSFEEPLFHIHLNVDYPFKLTGILYFPKLKNNIQLQRNKIQLYSNQVFITDAVENIVPEFLTLLHGVIDSPDIPLNVSRSYLQEDGNVKKISSHITKKVADKLVNMFKNDREQFEKQWDDIKVFVEYGMLTDEKFSDKIKPAVLFKNTEDKCFTIEEYRDLIKEKQTDKNDTLVCLYASNVDEQHAYIESAKNRGYDVLVLDTPLTSHWLQQIEMKEEKISFKRVDADTVDKLIEKDEVVESNLTEDQQNELKPIFEGVVNTETFTVQFESLNENDDPVVITRPEFMRRMKEQQEVGGGMFGMGNLPEMYNMIVNSNHPLVSKILMEQDGEKRQSLSKQAVDLAKLSQGMLKGKELTNFIKRSVNLID